MTPLSINNRGTPKELASLEELRRSSDALEDRLRLRPRAITVIRAQTQRETGIDYRGERE